MPPFAPQIFAVVFGALFTGVCGALAKVMAQYKAVNSGLKCLLRIEIIHEHEHYTEKGCIPVYAMDNINESYKAYTALGGNGTVPKLVEELKKLPTRKEDAKC